MNMKKILSLFTEWHRITKHTYTEFKLRSMGSLMYRVTYKSATLSKPTEYRNVWAAQFWGRLGFGDYWEGSRRRTVVVTAVRLIWHRFLKIDSPLQLLWSKRKLEKFFDGYDVQFDKMSWWWQPQICVWSIQTIRIIH